jgi:anti-sigma regulatory factor (Ser/Thr protein kinase)
MNASSLAHTRTLPPLPAPARRELRAHLEAARWPGDVDSVVLAVHEALMNSQNHAGGATSARVGLDGSDVVVEVRDEGPGFDVVHHSSHPPDPLSERGRGLWLISQLADRWDVRQQQGETCFCLRFRP